MPLDQPFPQTERHLLREHGFPRTRLTLDQQRAGQGNRRVDGHAQIIGRYVAFGSLKFHHLFNIRKKQSRQG